jgi:two-component system invasion response regulator UvrY
MSFDKIKIALVDDHTLFRKGLLSLIEVIEKDITILFEADNGLDMQEKLDPENLPDIILMDVNMPGMDGYDSVKWLKANHPNVKVLVVSMIESEDGIIKMLKLGVKGYLSKDVEPDELNNALTAIINKGFYYTDFITGKLVHTMQTDFEEGGQEDIIAKLTDKERRFIQLACSDMTYNDVAAEMFLSPKTIDGYRNSLFEKLNVKSRVALALYAVKHGIVKL